MPKIKVRESGRDCSICLEEFEVDGEGREMPCKHVFHSGCIEKWLQIHGSCPVCRFLMPAETVEVGGGRGLEFLHSLLAYASRTNLIGAAGSARGSHQPASGRADDDDTPSN
ncbi:putative Ribosomal protein L34e superfamily protein [Hibiscus syriacus]|uniref:RING-type E3 ubiquitin transferase n=1 Tax=Hibiscus syriacus TaxID=106335 RepID=A0A6A3D235_HIBSY|nr:E3 ubiquitin-protein ligase MPSR1-like [Hibiscus syriacus]KAE8735823.1 putative Ribosomal protein L34e superfamily protein [Hibiscus syriacus]